jgi:CRP-like cAMP-binding protein
MSVDQLTEAPHHERLLRALLNVAELSSSVRDAIRALPGRMRELQAYEDLICEGDQPRSVAILTQGFACRYKTLQDGGRQIVSFHVPGDALDLQSLFIDRMDHHVGTLTESTVLLIPHEALLDLFRRLPEIGTIFWHWSLIDASIVREWVTNVGRRDAYARMAHLLCELMTRMKVAGLAPGQECQLPLTQAELGDATGISTVHVNRMLQTLRANKLILLRSGSLTILNWDELKRVGEFDPGYLHLRQRAA